MFFYKFIKLPSLLLLLICCVFPSTGFCQDELSAEKARCKNKIAELDMAIARLEEQKTELLQRLNNIGDLSPLNTNNSWADPVLGIEFIWIPEGCFSMGDRHGIGDQDESPSHKVCLDGFYMSKFEMTQAQYTKVMRNNPSSLKSLNGYPVESVSWNEIKIFLSRLNQVSTKKMRLPTEAEWEYAARSGDTRYQYAGSDVANEVAWSLLNDANIVHKVGLKQPNSFGLYDLSGNLSEWCSDWYNPTTYADSAFKNPQGPVTGQTKVLRGGNFQSFSAQLRVADRSQAEPHMKLPFVGFRLAFTP